MHHSLPSWSHITFILYIKGKEKNGFTFACLVGLDIASIGVLNMWLALSIYSLDCCSVLSHLLWGAVTWKFFGWACMSLCL